MAEAEALADRRAAHHHVRREAAMHPAAEAHGRHGQLHQLAHHGAFGAEPADDDLLQPSQRQNLALVQEAVVRPFLAAGGPHAAAVVADVIAAALGVAGAALGIDHVDHQSDQVLADVRHRHEQGRARLVGDPVIVGVEAGLGPRQIESAVAQLDGVLVIEALDLVAILGGLVLLHLGHLVLGALIEIEAVVIGEEELCPVRADGARMGAAERT